MSAATHGASDPELCSVAEAADLLRVHPKTILRYIRDKRLPATRIGKSHRIVRSELQSLAGLGPRAPAAPTSATTTCLVDLEGISPALAQRWSRVVPDALRGRPSGGRDLTAQVLYRPESGHLKIVLVGAPTDVMRMLGLISVWTEQLTP